MNSTKTVIILIILDGAAEYVDDGREIFDEDLDEKPTAAGNDDSYADNVNSALCSELYIYIYME